MARSRANMLREHKEVKENKLIEDNNIINEQNGRKKFDVKVSSFSTATSPTSTISEIKPPLPISSSSNDIHYTIKADIAEVSGLIKVSALGDDRNLIDHGIKDVHYHYSVNDVMHLSTWLRSKYLEPVKFTSIRKEDRGAFFIENTSDILLPEPYHQDNFVASLANDISRITGTGSFEGRHKWFNMPKTIIIPVLSPGHWRSVIVTIDYNEQIGGIYKVNILFDDPFGQGKFPSALKKLYSGIIERQVEKLIQIENEITHRPILNITEEDREGDQQGRGENSWDCGPIIFSSIEDLIKYHQPDNQEDYNYQYKVPEYSSEDNQATILSDIRLRDIGRYNETAGIPIDEIRFKVIKEQLSKLRASKFENIKKSGFESNITGMSDWDAVYIDMFFSVLDNKRVAEGIITATTPYTQDEINYAYQLVLLKKHAKDQDNEIEKNIQREKFIYLPEKSELLPNLSEVITNLEKRGVSPFSIINDQEYEIMKENFVNGNEYLKDMFIYSLIAKDIHALTILAKLKNIRELFFNKNDIYILGKRVIGILVDYKILEEKTIQNKKVLQFLKSQGFEFIPHESGILFKDNLLKIKGVICWNGTSVEKVDKNFAQGISDLCKALYSKTDNKAFFKKTIYSFKKYIDIQRDIKDDKYLNQAIETIININTCYRDEESNKIENYIIEVIKKYPQFLEKYTLDYYTKFVEANYLTLNYIQALKYAILDYEYYKKDSNSTKFTKQEASQIIFNLGLCIKHYDANKALEYFLEADSMFPIEEIFQQSLKCYLRIGDFEGAIRRLDKIENDELRTLNKVQFYLISEKPLPEELKLKYQFYMNNSNSEQDTIIQYKRQDIKFEQGKLSEREANKYIEDVCHSIEEFAHYVLNVLQRCQKSGCNKSDWEPGLKIIEKFYCEQPGAKNHSILDLRCYEFLCYIHIGLYEKALITLEFLKALSPLNSETLSLAHKFELFYIYKMIEEKDYDNVKIFLVNNFAGEENEKIKITNLVNILIKENIRAHEKEEIIDFSKKEQSISLKSSDTLISWNGDDINELDKLFLDPKTIHAYFQNQKEKLYKTPLTPPTLKSSFSLSWDIKTKIKDNNPINIFKIENKKDFYAAISKDIIAKLDSVTFAQFTIAIKKGFAAKSVGHNGIKFLNNKIVELKIAEGTRLYTKVIYKNEEGKYLIIFDHKGNHETIKKALLERTEIETIEVSSKLKPLNLFTAEDGINNDEYCSYLQHDIDVEDKEVEIAGDEVT